MRNSESVQHKIGRRPALLVLVLAALLLLAGVVWAADGYDLSWYAIGGGGGPTQGGGYALDGAILQPAGVMSGGDYQSQAGFWYGAGAAPGPTVALRFSPSSTTAHLCSSRFTVDLDVRDVANLGGFDFRLAFNPSVVHVESIVLGTFLTVGPRPFTPVGPNINNDTGRATFGAFSYGAQPAPSGSGPIATITFSVVDMGSSVLELTRFQLTDPDGAIIPAAAESGSITVLPGLSADVDCDCDVDIVDIMLVASRWDSQVGDPKYDPHCDRDHDGDIDIVDIMLIASHWGESCTPELAPRRAPEQAKVESPGRGPSGPALRIEPESSRVQPGDVLTVQVMADDVADLGGFEFTLTFNAEVVGVEGVELGPLLAGTGRTAEGLGPAVDNTAGSLRFGGFSFGAAPGAVGGGTVAVIRLRAVATGSSSLEFSTGRFADTQGQGAAGLAAGEAVVVVSGAPALPAPTEVLTPRALPKVVPLPTREGP